MTKENIADIESFLKDSIDTLKSLEGQSGVPLAKGPRKIFVIGFCISALSILKISKNHLNRSVLPFEYVITYTFSQDHIELYVSKLRDRFGWNNNPTALQLKYGIRALLLKNKVPSPSTANCLNVSDQDTTEMAKVDPRLSNILLSATIWRSDVFFFISGYIVKKLIDCIDCPDCISALHGNPESSEFFANHISLLFCKKYGNLIVPSNSVYEVVDCVDKEVRKAFCKWAHLAKETNGKIMLHVMAKTRNSTFQSLNEHSKENHILDNELRDDHITYIIKMIVKNYLLLFYHQCGKVFADRILRKYASSIRQQLTKLILLQNE